MITNLPKNIFNKYIYRVYLILMSLLDIIVLGKKIILGLFDCLRKMGKVSGRDYLYHFVVESILLRLDLLYRGLKELNFVNHHQGTFVVVIILFFPEFCIILALISNIIQVDVFLIIVFINITLFFLVLGDHFLDSLFGIFSYQFDKGFEHFWESYQNKLWLFWVFH